MGRPSSAGTVVSSSGDDGGADDKKGNFLCLCDTISLYSEDHNAFLGAEGFADNRTLMYVGSGEEKPIKFSDCMFQIMPQHNYAAFKALKKHKKKMIARAAAEAEAAADALKGKKRKKERKKES